MKHASFIFAVLILSASASAVPFNTNSEPDLTQSGFVELFNGKDLSGWNVRGGQMLFDVKDGVIIGTNVKGQPNGFLCTDKIYDDFIFTAEFRWEVLGNSGIMFRSDTKEEDGRERVFGYQSEMDEKDRRWTGGIYGEAMGGWKYSLSDVEGHAAARAAIQDYSAWNRMTIHAEGQDIKTWVNGIPCAHLISDERSEGFFGLQVHGGNQGAIHWRNIRVKELGGDVRWTDLFKDGSFAQWTRVDGSETGPGWSIENGVVHRSGVRPGDIVTRKLYEDFEMTFDWKISGAGNSGVKYRARGSLGLEYQILDDINHKDGKNPAHRTASLYDILAAPDNKPARPAGEWNSARIVAKGPNLEHWLNGVKVMSISRGSDAWKQRFEKSKYREHGQFGLGPGTILLQDHSDEVWFRNVRVRELTN